MEGDLWRESVAESFEGVPLRRLCWSHFLLHTAAHYTWHLRTEFAALKGLADCLLVLNRHRAAIDGAAFWETARRWRVEAEVARVAATLHHVWGAGIPGVPDEARPFPAFVLGRGTAHRRLRAVRARWDMLAAAGALPDAASRAHYLRAFFLPNADFLSRRYGPEAGADYRSCCARYLRDGARRFAREAFGARFGKSGP